MMTRFKKLIFVWVLSLFVLTACISIKPTGTAGGTQQSAASTGVAATPPNHQVTTPTQAAGSPQATPTSQPRQVTPSWQQYQSTNLGITITYPAGWSATENQGEVAFESPVGDTILLDQIQANDLSPQDFLNQNQLPNTRCSSGKNSYGVQYRTCFDTIALSTNAYLVINPTQGSTQFFTLSTLRRGDLDVFNAMLASFHAS
jgi:hypothetical protein